MMALQVHNNLYTCEKKNNKCLELSQEAALAAQRRLEESQKEQEDLAETTRQLRRDLVELQDQKSELESQVEMLQLQSQQLQKRVRCVFGWHQMSLFLVRPNCL